MVKDKDEILESIIKLLKLSPGERMPSLPGMMPIGDVIMKYEAIDDWLATEIMYAEIAHETKKNYNKSSENTLVATARLDTLKNVRDKIKELWDT